MTLREEILKNSGILFEEDNIEQLSYLDKLKRLINAELVAAMQYKIASEAIIGPEQSYLVNHFREHFFQETDHYTKLVKALMERKGHTDLNLSKVISEANPATKELTDFSSESLKQFFIEAEDAAIKAYQEYYDEIKDGEDTKDLADIINGIISDEREHKLDFTRIEKQNQ